MSHRKSITVGIDKKFFNVPSVRKGKTLGMRAARFVSNPPRNPSAGIREKSHRKVKK